MPSVKANGVELYFEQVGPRDAPTILLIMGLGTQMIAWPRSFVEGLVAAGFQVLSFDNRDVGMSQHLDGAPAISPVRAYLFGRLRIRYRLAYNLNDMAADTVALCDGLGIGSSHVVGASMGGAIGQIIAARWPNRVRSLTSIMSTSGAPGLPGPSAKLRHAIIQRRSTATDREGTAETGDTLLQMISYPDPARPANAFRDGVKAAYDRGMNPSGFRRQLLAIIADGSRAGRLTRIATPTLVIHGAADPLVPLPCGADVARRIPGAKLEVIREMAHDLPPSQIPRLVRLVADHAKAAEGARAS